MALNQMAGLRRWSYSARVLERDHLDDVAHAEKVSDQSPHFSTVNSSLIPAAVATAARGRSDAFAARFRNGPGASFAFSQGPVSRASRPFIGSTLQAHARLPIQPAELAKAGADANKIGDFLCKMATGSPKLKLQIVANSAPIPWGMLLCGRRKRRRGARLERAG